jgi:hypothetical protein
MKILVRAILMIMLVFSLQGEAGQKAQDQMVISEGFNNIPLYFIPNQGQVNAQANYYVQTSGYTLWLTDSGLVFDSIRKKQQRNESKADEAIKIDRDVSRMTFLGASPEPVIKPLQTSGYYVNIFRGDDSSDWRTNISASRSILYKDLYPGIDLKIYGKEREIEYDWVIEAGSDPQKIAFTFKGADRIEINNNGQLSIHTQFGKIKHQKPYSFQIVDGKKVPVKAEFEKKGDNTFGFKIGDYDRSRQLCIDPVVVPEYSTFLGGGAMEIGIDIAVDSSNCVYAAGYTHSTDFPLQGAYQNSIATAPDIFVTKFAADGQSLLYSTYLGGSSDDYGHALAVDSSNCVYLTGKTYSSDFPRQNAYQYIFAGGQSDSFITKFAADGQNLVFSTYLGGSDDDIAEDVIVDSSGYAYISGYTKSSDFPMSIAYQSAYGGGTFDAFLTKFTLDGQNLAFSTYLGGSLQDHVYGMALDSYGFVYLAGSTRSTNFPLTTDAVQNTFGGGLFDAFVTVFGGDGQTMPYSTYLGGQDRDYAKDVAVDSSGCFYVTGHTASNDFPTVNAFQDGIAGGENDVFVSKLSQDGEDLVYSTFIGGDGRDEGEGITVDNTYNATVIGLTESYGFPTHNAFDSDHGNPLSTDAFVAQFTEDGQSLNYSTFLGGGDYDYGKGIKADTNGRVYAVGYTRSSDFPIKNAYSASRSGNFDAFVTILSETNDVQPFSLLSPSDGASGQFTDVDLDWEDALNAESYDVYFGTFSPPPFAANISASSYDPGSLSYDEEYYWCVTAKNASSSYASEEWSFHTVLTSVIIDGNVTYEANGLSGVTMTGLPASPETSSTGYYTDSVDTGWSGTVTPVLAGYIFTPTSIEYNNVTTDHTGQDYTAIIETFSISGTVTFSDAGLEGVLMTGLPGPPVTAGDGTYSGTVDYGWTGTVEPSAAGFTFEPLSLTLYNVSRDWPAADFEADGSTSPSSYQVIPEVIWASSAHGGSWVTEVQITDVDGGADVDVYFNSITGERRGPIDLFTGAGPDTSVKTGNLLQTLELLDPRYTYRGKIGAVEFETQGSNHKIHVIARTKNGDYSKTFSGLNRKIDNTAGESRAMMIQNLIAGDSFRTTCGGFNPTYESITVEYEIFDGDGNTLGSSFTKTYPGRGLGMNYKAFDLFDEAGISYESTSYTNAWVKITPVSGRGELMSYAASANNATNDPAVHTAVQASDVSAYNSPSHYQVIPEVLWAPAVGGGTWMTEVQITDITGSSEVSVYFNTSSGERRGPIALFTGSSPGFSAKTGNLLQTLEFLDPEFDYYRNVGAVEFVTQDTDHKIQVMARTSNGDYAKTFQGLTLNFINTASIDRTLMVQNLVNNSDYRAAFGAFNPTDESITAEFTILDENGDTIGTVFTKTFSGRQYQAFNPFDEAGVPYPWNSCNNTFIKVEGVSGSGQLMVYGATANNNTSDPAVHRAVLSH